MTASVETHLQLAIQMFTESDLKSPRRDMVSELLRFYVLERCFPSPVLDAPCISNQICCFIDQDGTPCALAFLMQSMNQAQLAEAIAHEHRFDSVQQVSPQVTVSDGNYFVF